MHLSVRLALSHLAVIVLFLVVFGLTFTLLNAPAQPGNGRQLWRLRRLLENDQLKRIPALRLSKDASLEVFAPDGSVQHLHGPKRPAPNHLPDGVWEGAEIAQFSTTEGVSFWFPVHRQGKIVGIARLSGLRSREELRRTAAGGVAMACLAATAFCLLASWGLSRALAGPARRLATTAEQFGSDNLEVRVKPEGPIEMVELGKSFNRMADRLAHNVEELQRSESARRLFLSDVSHNLRTPLAAIVGWADALSEEPEPAEAAVMLTRLRREAVYVSRTIERLLDLSRWDQAEPLLRLEPVVLADILMEVAETLEEPAQR
ncbi:MAG: HAMP domain-containing histidine kinase, partial [Candidatus Eremiobacteraeota bacterium]|nr:HAMP domain-containing histidine kinase [Candidatus Eremiobacteraeota bacterium]